MGNSLPTDAPPLKIHTNGVQNLLEGLDPDKASGPDEIFARFLKDNQGTVPHDWKGAFVTPLYKREDKSKAAN